MNGSDSDQTDLHEQLSMCRRELAQLREQQESWAEELSRVRRKRITAEKRLLALSIAADQKLCELDASPPGRSLRRILSSDDLRDQVALLQSSDLFRGPWYLRQNPDVVSSGMSPARHYLMIGADLGLDPGPRFQTRTYLQAHPDAVGINPLVHHLRSVQAAARAGGSRGPQA